MTARCTKSVTNTLVKVEENKKKAVFRNKVAANYDISQVDGCLITEGMRCDKLITKTGVVSVLVELKGRDVAHACDQLFATVEHPSIKEILEKKIGFLVICSKVPRFDGFVVKAKQRAAKTYKAGFHVVCNQGEFDIERVAAIDGPR